MPFDFDRPVSRAGTHSVKWEFIDEDGQRKHRGPDQTTSDGRPIIPMWVADMDFRCPPAVIEALSRRVRQGVFGYTFPTSSYYDAVADWIRRRDGWRVQREWIVITPGVGPALKNLVQTFTAPGEKVLIQPPVYHPFYHAIEKNDRRVATNPLVLENGRYKMDFENLAEKAADPEVRMAILCSPHNPIGRVWTEGELRRFAEICLENDVLVVADEVHCDLIYPGRTFFSFANLGQDCLQKSVICRAASKAFNLAGLQTSNIIIPDLAQREKFSATIDRNAGINVNAFGIVAAEAAFRHGEPWLEAVMEYVAGNYRFMEGYFEAHLPELALIEPQGTFLVWADFRPLGLDAAQRKTLLFEQAGVLLDDGEIFGPQGDGFQRFNIACPRQTLEEALDRIRAAIAVFGA